MQTSSGRNIPSVSDLYGTDEIDVLLEEIRDLEPAGCRAEDIQDFEIAGSRTGVAHLESPAGTVRSWDSHANYRQHTGSSPTGSLFSGVILYCDDGHFRSSAGVLRIILVVSIIACLACLCSSGTMKVSLFMLPLAGRLRLMLFVTVFSLLVTCLFLFLDISHIVYLFPFNWGKVVVGLAMANILLDWGMGLCLLQTLLIFEEATKSAILYVSISILYLIASSLVVHMVHAEAFSWVPKWSKDQLLVTGILGYLCGLEGILISLVTKCHRVQYCPVDEEPPPGQLMLEENRTPAPRPPAITQQRRAPPKPAPSSTNSWPIDDVQPCSSKNLDPYSMA